MNLLAINSSILEDYSISRQLMTQFLDHWQYKNPQSEVIYRDLNAHAINHLSSELIKAKQKPVTELSPELRRELELSEELISEFLNADELVIGAPMYNFAIPTQLKSWIDRILVAGRTFKYTPQGAQGLAGDKQVTIISTRGNHYSSNEEMQAKDFQENYLKTIFNFIGINEIKIIRAEGLHLSEESKKQSMEQAEYEIKRTFLELV